MTHQEMETRIKELEKQVEAFEQQPKIGIIPVHEYHLGDNVVYGTDGNLYKITVSSGKEYEQEPCDNCKYLDGDGCRLLFEQIEYGKASNDCPCEDAISRQAVLDIASNSIFDLQYINDNMEFCNQIEALPSVTPTQGWIPVSERLPEFEQKVLAWVENKDPEGRFNEPGIYTATLTDRVPEHDPEGKKNIWGIPGYDSEWIVWSWSYFTEPDVKAWMPLPQPYRAESEE